MDAFWQTLINQAPGTAAIIYIVALFLKDRREQNAILIGLIEELKKVKEMVIEHDVRVTEGMEAMYRESAKRARKPKATGD